MVYTKTLFLVIFSFICLSECAKVQKRDKRIEKVCAAKPDGTLLPSPEDCSKFISCNAGLAFVGSCPVDLYFNPENLRCDYQSNVDCHIGDAEEEEEDVECPSDGISFTASKVRCDWYYICMQGTPSRMVCANGLHFNAKESRCEAKETANCQIETSTTIDPTTPSTTTTKTTSEKPLSSTTPPPSDNFDKYCKPDQLHTIPHPFDCNLFILCFNGTAIIRYCGEDLHYSAKDSLCLPPREAQCIADGTICPEINDVEDIVVIENIYDCNSFFMCFNGSPVPIKCAPGQHWSQEKGTCVLEKNSKCQAMDYPFIDLNINKQATCHATGTYFVPQPTNGTTFLLCDNGTPSVIDYSPIY